MWLYAPGEQSAVPASSLGIDLGVEAHAPVRPTTLGERIEHSPVLLLPVVALGIGYLVHTIAARSGSVPDMLNALDLNTINLFLLTLGALLHWTPASLMRAVREATPATWGVLLQFPFYGGIFGIMTGTVLSSTIAGWFVRASTTTLYPAMVVAYSALLGIFVPSGGSKWVIEAPYVLQSAQVLGVPGGWMVVTYDLGEAIANLLQPFWMLPTLAILGLKARHIMGYTYLVAVVLFPAGAPAGDGAEPGDLVAWRKRLRLANRQPALSEHRESKGRQPAVSHSVASRSRSRSPAKSIFRVLSASATGPLPVADFGPCDALCRLPPSARLKGRARRPSCSPPTLSPAASRQSPACPERASRVEGPPA